MAELLERLREDYVAGRIEVDEFERRLGPILKGEPLAEDLNRPEDLRYGPGIAIPVSGDDFYPTPDDDWEPDAERELERRRLDNDPT